MSAFSKAKKRKSMALSKKYELIQKEVCAEYDVSFCAANENAMTGISTGIGDSGAIPVHGLRHPIVDGTTGWFLWAGDYSDADDFFKPIHTKHLTEWCPNVIKFLGLPPGWRFLKAGNYEDVWFDKNLLNI